MTASYPFEDYNPNRKVGTFKDHGFLSKFDIHLNKGEQYKEEITQRLERTGDKIKSEFGRMKEGIVKAFSPKSE